MNTSYQQQNKRICSENTGQEPDPEKRGHTITVTEFCPHCENEIEMVWDTDMFGYKAFCPVCGERLMLCDECRHSGSDGELTSPCDYDSVSDTCRFNQHGSSHKEQTVYVLFSCDDWASTASMRFIAVYDSLEKLKKRISARIRGEYFEFDSGIGSAAQQEAAFLDAWNNTNNQDEQMRLLNRIKYCFVTEATINDSEE